MKYKLDQAIYVIRFALTAMTKLDMEITKGQGKRKEEGYYSGAWAEKDEAIERTQKLEDTLQFRYEQLLGQQLPEVTIHMGGPVQEGLRESGAVAMARGNDVYIREEAYQEGSTLTDAIMLHELTHVLQAQEDRRIMSYEERETAEIAAARNEALASPVENGYYYAKIGDHLCYMNDRIAEEAIRYATELMKEEVKKATAEGDAEQLIRIARALRSRV